MLTTEDRSATVSKVSIQCLLMWVKGQILPVIRRLQMLPLQRLYLWSRPMTACM